MSDRAQSALFYSVAIGSVVALFSVTTYWGEANLKAAHNIAGTYRVTEGDCLQAGVFYLEQSGKYLTASVLPANATSEQTIAARKRPMLSATWAGQLEVYGGTTINFSGSVPQEMLPCIPSSEVQMEIVLVDDRLEGTLAFPKAHSLTHPLQVTAHRETDAPQKTAH
ncbi:MAG: hypothetical protein VKJ24_00215 [Synechococcales bacterium]|nr:hypothetical protein [Synechococcales bacterium]